MPPTAATHDLLVGAEAQARAQRLAIGERGGIERQDVAGEVEVLARPVADARQAGTELGLDHVVRAAHEQRGIADAWQTRDLLDHLGVVVGGQQGFTPIPGHRRAASPRSR